MEKLLLKQGKPCNRNIKKMEPVQGNPCKSEILAKQRKTCKFNREKNVTKTWKSCY